jgi:hypothetical protein
MGRLLFVVEGAFLIRGRGLLVLPGITPSEDERYSRGDPILLRRPDGSAKLWRIGQIELMMTPVPRAEVPIVLEGLGSDDVPVGTEVWSVAGDESTLGRHAGGPDSRGRPTIRP